MSADIKIIQATRFDTPSGLYVQLCRGGTKELL